MPIVDLYGTLDGQGGLDPAALFALYDLTGELPGAGNLTGTLVWWLDFDGSVAGFGSMVGTAALFMPLGGGFSGTGDVSGDPAYWVNVSGSLVGSSSVSTPSPILTFLVGGQMFGFGTIYDTWLQDFAGVVQGLGQISGSFVLTSPLAGLLPGQGDLIESVPLPLLGFGTLAAYMEVVRAPGPACPCAEPPTKSFGYRQTLGKCDLTLCLTDGYGNNYSPVTVSYAVYQVLRGGYRQLRGPAKRTPVMTPDGCYYAPFVAGDCGQPGDWVIVWTWQRAPGFPVESRAEPFRVLDQAMQTPCDPSRKRKFGWNC